MGAESHAGEIHILGYSGGMNSSQSTCKVPIKRLYYSVWIFRAEIIESQEVWLVMLCNEYHGPICTAMHINWRTLSQAPLSSGTLPHANSAKSMQYDMSRIDKG